MFRAVSAVQPDMSSIYLWNFLLSVPFWSHMEFHSTICFDFHKLLKRKEICNVENCFSVLHTNISSLQCDFSKLELLLHNLDHYFKVIAVTETWNSVHKKHLFAPKILLGYHQYEGMTGKTLKSGCGFFIANDLSYFVRRDISKSFYSVSSEFQALWIEIINKKGPTLLLALYIDILEKMTKNSLIIYQKFSLNCKGKRKLS